MGSLCYWLPTFRLFGFSVDTDEDGARSRWDVGFETMPVMISGSEQLDL